MSEVARNDLPEGWERVPLKDAVHVILGQSPSSTTYNEEGKGLPFFQGKTEFGQIYPTVRKWCTKPKKVAEKDDILVSVRAPVGPTNLAPSECAIGRGLAALRPLGGSETKYFLYLIRRHQDSLAALGTGTTFEAISGDTLKNFLVPVAPIEQQKRIVAKIEELFSHIDAGIEALKKAKQLLKQYRQSVLKAAVTGELTKEWREANKGKLEPASQLLERILKERRQKWEEQQLEQFKAKGKIPKDDKWKDKYKLEEPNPHMSLDVPEVWAISTLESITDPVRMICYGILMPKENVKNGVLYVKVKDIKGGRVLLEQLNRTEPEIAKKYKRASLTEGDLLLTIRGSYGRTAITPSELEGGMSLKIQCEYRRYLQYRMSICSYLSIAMWPNTILKLWLVAWPLKV